MFTSKQYRDSAVEYGKRVDAARTPDEKREYHALERTFATLADNAEWLVANDRHTIRMEKAGAASQAAAISRCDDEGGR